MYYNVYKLRETGIMFGYSFLPLFNSMVASVLLYYKVSIAYDVTNKRTKLKITQTHSHTFVLHYSTVHYIHILLL